HLLERPGTHLRSARARLASPIKIGGSTARRGAIADVMLTPPTVSAAAITSLTAALICQVQRAALAFVPEIVKCPHVRVRNVAYLNVVGDTGAIGELIVIAKNVNGNSCATRAACHKYVQWITPSQSGNLGHGTGSILMPLS